MGFEDDLKAFEAKTLSRIRLFRRALALKVSARIILRTPVRTGRARANWQLTVGAPAEGEVNTTDPSGAETLARARTASADIGGTDSPAFITNNLPYIDALENGHSQQAPAGMVAVTIAEFEGVAEQLAEQIAGGGNGDTES